MQKASYAVMKALVVVLLVVLGGVALVAFRERLHA